MPANTAARSGSEHQGAALTLGPLPTSAASEDQRPLRRSGGSSVTRLPVATGVTDSHSSRRQMASSSDERCSGGGVGRDGGGRRTTCSPAPAGERPSHCPQIVKKVGAVAAAPPAGRDVVASERDGNNPASCSRALPTAHTGSSTKPCGPRLSSSQSVPALARERGVATTARVAAAAAVGAAAVDSRVATTTRAAAALSALTVATGGGPMSGTRGGAGSQPPRLGGGHVPPPPVPPSCGGAAATATSECRCLEVRRRAGTPQALQATAGT